MAFLAGVSSTMIILKHWLASYSFMAAKGLQLSRYRESAIHGLSMTLGLPGFVNFVFFVCAIIGYAVWNQGKLLTRKLSQHQTVDRLSPIGLEITANDIAKAIVLRGSSNSARKVVRVGSNILAKFGPDLNIAEAESMRFIHKHTSIPVPQVLNAYEKDGCRYILMKFVEGELLEKLWPKLSCSERDLILSELKYCIHQMRQIACPKNTLIGSVTGGPAVDRRQQGSVSGGPFKLEADFNEWQLAQLRQQTPLSNRDLYAGIHKTDHKIVFSHGDLAFHNIIVKDGHIAAIIDWEYSGWYPEHWDYCKTLPFLVGTDEGYLSCKKVFEKQYHDEYLMDCWFTREVQHGF
jgi:aminoglycoside phosphotransferase